MPNPRLVLHGVENLIDGESQRGEMLFCLEGSEWTWRKNQDRLSLKGRLPPVQVLGMGGLRAETPTFLLRRHGSHNG